MSKLKRSVNLELCDNDTQYEGRLIGLVDDKEFHCIKDSKRVQNKMFSSETKPLKEIADNFSCLNGLRMVIAVKSIDGKSVRGKKLFITERLSLISFSTTDDRNADDQIGVLGENDEFIFITEEVEQ